MSRVYGCRQGTLDVTILGKTGDRSPRASTESWSRSSRHPPEEAVTHRIPAPPYADGTRSCVFELDNPGYAGSTTITFVPA